LAKISESKGRGDANSGYVRVVGSAALGQLLSRIQATVVRNGNELERILKQQCPYYSVEAKLGDVHNPLDASKQVQVFFSYKHERVGETSIVGDVTVVDHVQQIVHIVELKDGDTFDTKKASGELASITALADALAKKLNYTAKAHFCAFNQDNKEAIVAGAKGRFGLETAMTGAELCALIGVDYGSIRQMRKRDETENFDFLMEQLLAIPEVKRKIEELLGERND